MPSPKRVFLTGATGYLGGSVLTGLLAHPDLYSVSALVRDPAQAQRLSELGVEPVLGSLDDAELLERSAAAADAVVHTAAVERLPPVRALVRGLQLRGNPTSALVLTSGTGMLANGGRIDEPYDDLDLARIYALPEGANHRDVDSWVQGNSAGIRFAIVAPSTVNGVGDGPFKRTSQQVIGLAKLSARRGSVGCFSTESVRWNNVHVLDLTDLYLRVLAGLLDGTADEGPSAGFYFGAAAVHDWKLVCEALAREMRKQGVVRTAEVTPFTPEQRAPVQHGAFSFTNEALAESNRAKKLGWRPTHPDLLATLPEEVAYLVANGEISKLPAS